MGDGLPKENRSQYPCHGLPALALADAKTPWSLGEHLDVNAHRIVDRSEQAIVYSPPESQDNRIYLSPSARATGEPGTGGESPATA